MVSIKQLAGMIAATTLLAAGTSQAQVDSCTSNSDCPKGMSCLALGVATPVVACISDGGACPPVATTARAVSICQLATCQTDADCGQDMFCHGETTTLCTEGGTTAVKCDPTAGACAPTPPSPPTTCIDTTTYQCAYKWQLPCNADADCGSGFVCQPTTSTECSASGGVAVAPDTTGGATSGVGGGSGGTATPLLKTPFDAGAATSTPVCTTTTSFPGSCQPAVATCASDADCPSVLVCAATYATTYGRGGVSSSGTGGGNATTGGATPMAVDAGVAVAPQPISMPPGTTSTATSTTTTVKTCQPPFFENSRGTSQGGGNNVPLAYVAAPDAGTAKGTATSAPPSPVVAPSGNGASNDQPAAASTKGSCGIGSGPLSRDSTLFVALLGSLGLLLARRKRAS